MDVEVQVKTSCGGPGGLLLAPLVQDQPRALARRILLRRAPRYASFCLDRKDSQAATSRSAPITQILGCAKTLVTKALFCFLRLASSSGEYSVGEIFLPSRLEASSNAVNKSA